MNKIVNISNDKKSILEFDIAVTGAVEDDMAVRFIIESEGMMLGFDSKKETGDTWSVEIPAMRILDKTVYPFYISVVVDGYTFEGLRGSVNVIGDRKVHISDPVLIPAKAKKKATKKVIPKEETKATVIKPKKKLSSKQIPLKVTDSAELLKALNTKTKKAAPKKEPLDDKTMELINKAKEEKAKVATDKIKKEESKKTEQPKKENKKAVPKKTTKKKEVKEDQVPPLPMVAAEKPKEGFSAKSIAQSLIKSVTGIGEQKETTVTEKKHKCVKDILKEDVPVTKATRKKASGKKVIRGKDIVEVDTQKEDKIKDILNEDNTRTITTTPFKKLH